MLEQTSLLNGNQKNGSESIETPFTPALDNKPSAAKPAPKPQNASPSSPPKAKAQSYAPPKDMLAFMTSRGGQGTSTAAAESTKDGADTAADAKAEKKAKAIAAYKAAGYLPPAKSSAPSALDVASISPPDDNGLILYTTITGEKRIVDQSVDNVQYDRLMQIVALNNTSKEYRITLRTLLTEQKATLVQDDAASPPSIKDLRLIDIKEDSSAGLLTYKTADNKTFVVSSALTPQYYQALRAQNSPLKLIVATDDGQDSYEPGYDIVGPNEKLPSVEDITDVSAPDEKAGTIRYRSKKGLRPKMVERASNPQLYSWLSSIYLTTHDAPSAHRNTVNKAIQSGTLLETEALPPSVDDGASVDQKNQRKALEDASKIDPSLKDQIPVAGIKPNQEFQLPDFNDLKDFEVKLDSQQSGFAAFKDQDGKRYLVSSILTPGTFQTLNTWKGSYDVIAAMKKKGYQKLTDSETLPRFTDFKSEGDVQIVENQHYAFNNKAGVGYVVSPYAAPKAYERIAGIKRLLNGPAGHRQAIQNSLKDHYRLLESGDLNEQKKISLDFQKIVTGQVETVDHYGIVRITLKDGQKLIISQLESPELYKRALAFATVAAAVNGDKKSYRSPTADDYNKKIRNVAQPDKTNADVLTYTTDKGDSILVSKDRDASAYDDAASAKRQADVNSPEIRSILAKYGMKPPGSANIMNMDTSIAVDPTNGGAGKLNVYGYAYGGLYEKYSKLLASGAITIHDPRGQFVRMFEADIRMREGTEFQPFYENPEYSGTVRRYPMDKDANDDKGEPRYLSSWMSPEDMREMMDGYQISDKMADLFKDPRISKDFQGLIDVGVKNIPDKDKKYEALSKEALSYDFAYGLKELREKGYDEIADSILLDYQNTLATLNPTAGQQTVIQMNLNVSGANIDSLLADTKQIKDQYSKLAADDIAQLLSVDMYNTSKQMKPSGDPEGDAFIKYFSKNNNVAKLQSHIGEIIRNLISMDDAKIDQYLIDQEAKILSDTSLSASDKTAIGMVFDQLSSSGTWDFVKNNARLNAAVYQDTQNVNLLGQDAYQRTNIINQTYVSSLSDLYTKNPDLGKKAAGRLVADMAEYLKGTQGGEGAPASGDTAAAESDLDEPADDGKGVKVKAMGGNNGGGDALSSTISLPLSSSTMSDTASGMDGGGNPGSLVDLIQAGGLIRNLNKVKGHVDKVLDGNQEIISKEDKELKSLFNQYQKKVINSEEFNRWIKQSGIDSKVLQHFLAQKGLQDNIATLLNNKTGQAALQQLLKDYPKHLGSKWEFGTPMFKKVYDGYKNLNPDKFTAFAMKNPGFIKNLAAKVNAGADIEALRTYIKQAAKDHSFSLQFSNSTSTSSNARLFAGGARAFMDIAGFAGDGYSFYTAAEELQGRNPHMGRAHGKQNEENLKITGALDMASSVAGVGASAIQAGSTISALAGSGKVASFLSQATSTAIAYPILGPLTFLTFALGAASAFVTMAKSENSLQKTLSAINGISMSFGAAAGAAVTGASIAGLMGAAGTAAALGTVAWPLALIGLPFMIFGMTGMSPKVAKWINDKIAEPIFGNDELDKAVDKQLQWYSDVQEVAPGAMRDGWQDKLAYINTMTAIDGGRRDAKTNESIFVTQKDEYEQFKNTKKADGKKSTDLTRLDLRKHKWNILGTFYSGAEIEQDKDGKLKAQYDALNDKDKEYVKNFLDNINIHPPWAQGKEYKNSYDDELGLDPQKDQDGNEIKDDNGDPVGGKREGPLGLKSINWSKMGKYTGDVWGVPKDRLEEGTVSFDGIAIPTA